MHGGVGGAQMPQHVHNNVNRNLYNMLGRITCGVQQRAVHYSMITICASETVGSNLVQIQLAITSHSFFSALPCPANSPANNNQVGFAIKGT